MRPLTDDRGGIVAKLLGILLVLSILASAAVYVYGKGQQPLEADIAHTATSDGDREAATIGVGPHMAVYAATIVRNAGRLPVTIEGLASVPRGRASRTSRSRSSSATERRPTRRTARSSHLRSIPGRGSGSS